MLRPPLAGGVVAHDYLHGVSAFLNRCAELKWFASLVTQPDGLVTRSRNSFASLVMRHESYTHLLMLDADIVVATKGLERLVRSGHDVVGSAVPLRNVNWDRAREAAETERNVTVDQLRLVATDYAVWFEGDRMIATDGSVPVVAVGSAAMLVSRKALVAVVDAGLVQYAEQGLSAADGREDGWTFFDPFVYEDGIYLSEDYAFCHRWRATGGQVFVDTQTPTKHVGPASWVVHDEARATRCRYRTAGHCGEGRRPGRRLLHPNPGKSSPSLLPIRTHSCAG